MIRNPWEIQELLRSKRVSTFAKEVLGITLHSGQVKWVDNSWKLINILDPSNQWGKTMSEAVFHIFHAMTKPQLEGRVTDVGTWQRIEYVTLNVGKTYEIAKGVMEAIADMVEGNLLLPNGSTNHSLLKGWAIKEYSDTQNKAPYIKWWNNSSTLIRSYDDLGSSFKRLKLAFVSSDECGDIPELDLFLNGTLLPRITFWGGQIHLIGTHQPKGEEYARLSEQAVEDMERAKAEGLESDYYHQTGNLYENPYMDAAFVKKMENIADPRLREQIIFGKYVDSRNHFFTFEEIDNMFVDLPWDEETGFTEKPDPEGCYIFSVDLAASEDETAVTVIRYNQHIYNELLRKTFDMPYKVVFHKGFKGKTIPISMQYELIRSWFMAFKQVAPRTTFFTFDAGSLGGKNAADAFKDLYGYPFPGMHKSYATEKAYAIGALKEVVTRGRKVVKTAEGKTMDVKTKWGYLRISNRIKVLRKQFEAYALEDKGLRQDRIATVWQAIHFIEKRRPKQSHNQAVNLDILSSTIPNYGR